MDKYDYKDTDKKIEINLYGIIFEIKDVEKISDVDKMDRNDKSVIEDYIKVCLGEDSIDRINKKRISDGYEEADVQVLTAIMGCIYKTYSNAVTKDFNETAGIEEQNVDNSYNRNSRNYKNNRSYRSYRRY